ncbi:MAG: hypothetical protein LBR47_02905 [Spirochaetaceae bacterium]|jgi:hypothetical protein|nr:hypothetical protein [Spirochaetaceae bacterium]
MKNIFPNGITVFLLICSALFMFTAAGCKQPNNSPSDNPYWTSWPPQSLWAEYGIPGITEPSLSAGNFRGGWEVTRFSLNGITVSWDGVSSADFDAYRASLNADLPFSSPLVEETGYYDVGGAGSDMYTATYQYNSGDYTVFISRANQPYTIDGNTVPQNRMELSVLRGYAGKGWPSPSVLTTFGLNGIVQPLNTTIEAIIYNNTSIPYLSLTGMTAPVFAEFKSNLESATGGTFGPNQDDGSFVLNLMGYPESNPNFILSITYDGADKFAMIVIKI